MIAGRFALIALIFLQVILLLFAESYFAFLFLTVSLAIVLIAVFSLLLSRGKLSFSVSIPEVSAKYENFGLDIQVHNKSIFHQPRVTVRFIVQNSLSMQKELQSINISAPARRTGKTFVPLDATLCGSYDIRFTYSACYDFLGLLSLKVPLPEPVQFFILPETFKCSIDTEHDGSREIESVVYSLYKAGHDLSDTFGLREYQPGDSIRYIHWKLSSKLDNVIIRQPGMPVDTSVLLLMETAFPEEQPDPVATDMMVETIVSISSGLIAGGFPHTIAWFDYDTRQFDRNEIISDQNLTETIRKLLRPGRGTSSVKALAYYLDDPRQSLYSKVIYCTDGSARELHASLMDYPNILAIECKSAYEIEEQASAQYITVSPHNYISTLSNISL